ncbi:hypothetical protein BDV93DRAFT_602954 [Ceratobasidium sp. AG-I]|nr:hypothetical protein BDV93DRAFT_602954 [Ceratobasidium sp. AG-I]
MSNLLDLPSEILLHVFSCLMTPAPLSRQPFWLLDITPHALLSPSSNTREQREQRREQVLMAKSLSLVCRKAWAVFTPSVWSRFDCSTEVNLVDLKNACASERELGSHIQHLDLELRAFEAEFSSDMLSSDFAAIWPKLTSLYSLTLTLSPGWPCPQWLATQLRDIPALRSLHLNIHGSDLGPHLRALPRLEGLFVEIYHSGKIRHMHSPETSDQISLKVHPDRAGPFDDVFEMVDACVKDGKLKQLGLFAHEEKVDSLCRYLEEPPSLASLLSSVQISDPISSVALGPSIKQPIPSSLGSLSRLSLTLESRKGTEAFLRAMSGLPITDLALRPYDWSLLSGSNFRDFCAIFGKLRRLRLKLTRMLTGVGEPVANGYVDQDAFVQGLTSLKDLEAFKGPVMLRRRNEGGSLHDDAEESLGKLMSALKGSGTLSPDLLLQWHLCMDGEHGPQQFWVVPDEPVRLGDWQTGIKHIPGPN